jgi:hypothetical protein
MQPCFDGGIRAFSRPWLIVGEPSGQIEPEAAKRQAQA